MGVCRFLLEAWGRRAVGFLVCYLLFKGQALLNCRSMESQVEQKTETTGVLGHTATTGDACPIPK